MLLDKIRETNPKKADILEKLLFSRKTEKSETVILLAEGLSDAKTLAEVRSAAKSVLSSGENKS